MCRSRATFPLKTFTRGAWSMATAGLHLAASLAREITDCILSLTFGGGRSGHPKEAGCEARNMKGRGNAP
ncbi:hypothetical protein O3P69_018914 [Scylla paramamosain]|uniref:Secreted protein n=1 Tax=Scylla paramamosain TaxID=85552 RepID=A0AAW0SGC5_SCYPA